MTELKPCPFCGNTVRYIYDPMTLEPRAVYCKRCHASIKFMLPEASKTDTMGDIMERIAERWNKRT